MIKLCVEQVSEIILLCVSLDSEKVELCVAYGPEIETDTGELQVEIQNELIG